MNEQSDAPLLPSGPTPAYQVWMNALTKPNEQTFAEMAASPHAKATTAFLWVFLGSLVNSFLASLVQGPIMRQVLEQYGGGGQFQFGGAGVGGTFVRAICGAPIAAVIAVVIFAAVVGVVQFLARTFGGRGTFDQMAYTSAAIWTPFVLITSVFALFSAIPAVGPFIGLCFGIVSFIGLLYVLFLAVTAVKGVNQVGWGQAAGSCLLPVIVLFCCLAVGVTALGSAIYSTFESINQSLTP